ncbi:MAG: ABC transporter permease [Acidobacteriota bacterium]
MKPMADSTHTRFRFWLWLIRIIGVIVPRRLRADWRQEWEAELRYRELLLADWDKLNWRTKLDLLRRSLGAFRDALLLQPGRMEDEMFQDLRFGLRMLLKKPGFTLIAVFTIALGIGANTAIFSVVNAVLLRPLPFDDPERLLMVFNKGAEAAGGDRTPLAVADLFDWRAQSQSFTEIGAFQSVMFNYTGGESPERVQGAGVTANFFSMLGVQAALGRTFLPDEDKPGSQFVAVVSDGFWRKYLAGDQQVVGRSINLNGLSTTIVGVMPAGLDYPGKEVELWTAMQLQPPARRGPYFLRGVARLKPDVTLEQARTEVNTLKSSFSGDQFSFNVLPVNEFVVGDVRAALVLLLVAVTLVLLIAAVNVANLMLVRSAARSKEISIRIALGAGRARILRQLLTENLLLTVAGGLLGVLWATWGVRLLLKAAPASIPRLDQIGIDGRVLGWTALVSLMTGVIFGLAPAWQTSRLSINDALKEGGRGVTESPGKRNWRNLLVVSELALAVMLLVGAGLMVKSFWRLQRVDSGVDAERVLTMRLALRGQKYADPQRVDAFYPQLLERVEGLPGVRAAAVSNSLPPDSTEFSDDFSIEGRTSGPEEPAPIAYIVRVSPGYFSALGIPMQRGRYFNPADSASSVQVAIVNETLARKLFPQEDPIGKRINTGDERQPFWWEIVGIARDSKYNGLADDTQPVVYQPLIQARSYNVFLVVKTEATDPLSLATAVRDEIRLLDGDLPVAQVGSLEQRFDKAVGQPRFRTTLIAIFGLLALVLAAVGIYGVISYSVSQRTHEMGVRLALGAQTGDLLKLVLKQGAVLSLVGVAIGLSASAALTQLLKSLLFDVSATDFPTFISISLLLTTVALLACYIPARRAAKVDPLVALRHD